MSSTRIASRDNYEIIKFIGNGNFGVVSIIRLKADNSIVALKQINLKKYDAVKREELLNEAKSEYALLKKDLKNVVKSFESHYDEKDKIFYFSMEYFPENLKEFIENRLEKGLPELNFEDFLPIFQNMISGIEKEKY